MYIIRPSYAKAASADASSETPLNVLNLTFVLSFHIFLESLTWRYVQLIATNGDIQTSIDWHWSCREILWHCGVALSETWCWKGPGKATD